MWETFSVNHPYCFTAIVIAAMIMIAASFITFIVKGMSN